MPKQSGPGPVIDLGHIDRRKLGAGDLDSVTTAEGHDERTTEASWVEQCAIDDQVGEGIIIQVVDGLDANNRLAWHTILGVSTVGFRLIELQLDTPLPEHSTILRNGCDCGVASYPIRNARAFGVRESHPRCYGISYL